MLGIGIHMEIVAAMQIDRDTLIMSLVWDRRWGDGGRPPSGRLARLWDGVGQRG